MCFDIHLRMSHSHATFRRGVEFEPNGTSCLWSVAGTELRLQKIYGGIKLTTLQYKIQPSL